jgi:hypothetical protein
LKKNIAILNLINIKKRQKSCIFSQKIQHKNYLNLKKKKKKSAILILSAILNFDDWQQLFNHRTAKDL